ncbi:hypothetical protein GobsT_31030 [Gemmata obscuriglobus]|uniref:Uncharacterized protein n=1 Tax=Gemmata obscuriglobus TaxID=114 RepID=A0A2Z3H4U3_9BACT|nr:hypothetical protein [Gemmata obscuriglobus]AWM38707.1 hypothetical protein C1280_18070 [Gemmata obscuriglobus]QEG28326.1 hypothetical protein GobsT_31030 [Gemmata obscuriglobus]VTS06189.1 unnamed protein product [Gemmata obscuriglobus UQM 2246]
MDDDTELLILRRRRQQKQARRRMILLASLAGVGAVLLLAIVVVAGRAGSGRATTNVLGGPSNHAELADLLRSKGLQVSYESAGPLIDRPERPTSIFTIDVAGKRGLLMVHLNKSESAAREQVATMGGNGFACSRFALEVWMADEESKSVFLQVKRTLGVN